MKRFWRREEGVFFYRHLPLQSKMSSIPRQSDLCSISISEVVNQSDSNRTVLINIHLRFTVHWVLAVANTENLRAIQTQSGALSLVETFIELKYFPSNATPALLCHKEPAQWIGGFHAGKGSIIGAGSLWRSNIMISDLISDHCSAPLCTDPTIAIWTH